MMNWTRRSLRATAAVGIASIGLFGAAVPAGADPGSTSAFGLKTGGLVTAGPFAESSCGPGQCTPDQLASATVDGLITTGVLETNATQTGASSSVADVDADLSPITTLTATAVSSSCTAEPTTGGVSGDSSIVDGAITTSGSATELQASPAPNTEVTVIDPAVASVVLNRQTTAPDGTLTVDAIYVRLLSGQTITIASSSCTPTGVPIPVATGNGLLLGGSLLAVAGIGYLVTRGVVLARRSA